MNEIAVYRINNKTVAFTSIVGSPFPTGISPASVVAHPSKTFLYVANQGENDISLFKVNGQSAQLTELMPRTPTGIYPSALAMDSAGTVLFASNQASNNISAYTINASSGALTEVAGSPFPTGTGPTKLRVSPSGKYLYVLVGNLSSIYAYSINSGTLLPVAGSPFSTGATPSSFAIDPNEHFVYVTNASTSTVSVFAIDASGGLSAIPQSPFSTTTGASSTLPVDVATSPSGQFVYVLNSSSGNISEYSVGSTGILTLLTGSPVSSGGSGPLFLLLDSTGKFLFVGNQSSNNITVLSVGTDGTLASANSSATVASSPSSMFVLP